MKTRFCRFFFSLFISLLFVPQCFAIEDFIAPTKISFQVKPGETFSYDIIYKSGIGGVYDLSTRVFHYNENGSKSFLDEVPSYVNYDETVYEFQPGDEKLITIHVALPNQMEVQDVYLSHFMRRRSEEQQTFELGSLMFLRVGPVSDFTGTVSNIRFLDDPNNAELSQHGFRSIAFDFENFSERYFSISPVLEVLDQQGTPLETLKNPSTIVFPEFKKTVNFLNFGEGEVSLPQSGRAMLKVFAENDLLLHEEEVFFPESKVFLKEERLVSPFEGVNIRKGILYNPIFQISAIVIGLTLIGLSFFMNRK